MNPSPALGSAILSMATIPEHQLLHVIASGGYGQVWMARNRLGVLRAVKIVHRASFDHDRPFEREFAGIKAFEPISRSHEGLVDLLQVGRDDDAGYFYYVMELADDANALQRSDSASSTLTLHTPNLYQPRTLASELKGRIRLPLQECIQIGLSLTDALMHLHGQGLVHRDIKPSNIIFVEGTPKLADVGLVAAVADARSFVGTEGFIPPEGPGTMPADLYSLGIVLYVLSTGKSHQDFPEPLADLSSEENHARWLEFDAVVSKACQAQVGNRYRSAQEMRDDLALLQHGQSVKHHRAIERRWTVFRRVGFASLIAALLMFVAPFLKGPKPVHQPNAAAAHLYARGQWHYHQLTAADHKKALDYLTRATVADPKFVQPYAELTMLYVWNHLGVRTDRARLEKTAELAAGASAIDPNSAEAHIALSYCHFLERDWHRAEAEVALAIKVNPKLAIGRYMYSFYLTLLERFDEAHREAKLAEQLEPPEAARVTAIVAAFPYMGERRFDDALVQFERVLELDRNFMAGHSFLAQCYEAQSNYLAAIDEWRTADLMEGVDPPDKLNAAYDAVRQAYATKGQEGYFRKWIELTLAEESLPQDERIWPEEGLAGYYAILGDKAKALDEIEKHFDEPQHWHRIKFIALYDPLRGEPRYKALVKRAGLKP